MEKKKLSRTILIAVILIVILFFVVQLFSKGEQQSNAEPVSVNIARNVAETTLDTFEDWRGPTLDEWYTFYDLNQEPSAYMFNISDYYGKAGYTMISATTRLEPVIEVSKNPVTPVAKIVQLVKDISVGTIYDPGDIKSEYIYLGGGSYYARLTLREGSNATVKYYEVTQDGTMEVSQDQVMEEQKFYNKFKEENAQQQWNEFI
jgi:hypothetical protein